MTAHIARTARPRVVLARTLSSAAMTSVLLIGGADAIAHAQQPPPPATPPPATPAAEKPAPPKPYHYDPEGRRDPFVSLVARAADQPTPQAGRRIDGASGLLVNEVTLKGIVQSRGEYVAMIQGPDTKTFLVRANDKLLDGTIKSITAQVLVIMQDVNDPLSLAKQREVRKVLRAPQEGK